MREPLETTTRSSRWKQNVILLLLIAGCRESFSYVPVEVLTSVPTKSRSGCYSRRSLHGRKRSRGQSSNSIIRFAIQLDPVVNTTTTSSFPVRVAKEDPKSVDTSVAKWSSLAVPHGEPLNGKKKPEQSHVATRASKEASIADLTSKVSPNGRSEASIQVKNDRFKIDILTQDLSGDEGDDLSDEEEEDEPERNSIKSLWSRRYARTLEEGIRRETASELYALLQGVQIEARTSEGRRYVERSLMGLINALADEHEDLDVDMTTVADSPFWRKEVKEFRINFSRLGFKPIRLGGNEIQGGGEDDRQLSLIECADEAFDLIDKDKSGTLDREELAQALNMISEIETDKESVDDLASKLVGLYDFNGDGAVDREEYQQMVEDMANLNAGEAQEKKEDEEKLKKGDTPLEAMSKSVKSISQGISQTAAQAAQKASQTAGQVASKASQTAAQAAQTAKGVASGAAEKAKGVASAVRRKKKEPAPPPAKEYGSIVLSNLKIDLRRLVFGGFPGVKRITPGGPLILEPFSVTVNGSFTREDVMGSYVLDAGLKLLVARTLRVRTRSFRDIVDGAMFFGRKYKLNSKSAPLVEVLGLSNVEFDSNDKMVITGRAKIRTSANAPIITQTFKLRTKIGTGRNGQNIKLVEPELAFVFECPKGVEDA